MRGEGSVLRPPSDGPAQPPLPSSRPGDEHDFDVWYLAVSARVLRALHYDTGDWHLAQDIAQDACSQLLQRWEDDPPDNPTAWTMAVAFNRLRRVRRRQQIERRAWADEEPIVGGPTEGFSADVARAVRRLPPAMRRAVVLRYVVDLTEAGVAEAMGVTEGAASSTLSQARARLAAALAHVERPNRPARPETTARESDPPDG